jgi:membrane protein
MAQRKSLWQDGAEQVAALLETLRTWPWFDTLRTLRQRFREDHLGLTASSLTFTTMISLVPLVTVALALFAAFPVFDRLQAALQN